MDVRKVLADLQYRIQSTRENDPERENAIRLRWLDGSDPVEGGTTPSWGLYEAVKAARDLEDTIFPDMQLTQETLQIEGGK